MYQNMYNNPAPAGNFNPYEQNVGLLKKFFSKPVVIILAALNGAAALLGIVSLIIQMGTFDESLNYFIYMMGNQFSYIYSNLMPVIIIIAVFSILFSIITTLGYLILYLKSKNPDPQSNPKAGATILWIMSIIEFTLSVIASIFLIIVAVMLFVYLENASRYEANIIGVIGTLFILLSVFLILIYLFKMLFFASIHSSFNNVKITSRGSIAFAVFAIISAGFFVYSLCSSLDTATVMSVISSILSIITFILLAVFAIMYNSFVKSVTTGNTPVNSFMPVNNQFNGGSQYNKSNTNGQAPNMNIGYTYRPSQPPVNNNPVNNNPIKNNPMNNNPVNNNPIKNNPMNNNPADVRPADNGQFNQTQNQQKYQNPYGNPASNFNAAQKPAGDKMNNNPAYFSQEFKQGSQMPPKTNPAGSAGNQNMNSPRPAQNQKTQNKCPMCGAVHSGTDMFCGNCGARLK